MEHSAALIETIAIGLGAGFIGGVIAFVFGLVEPLEDRIVSRPRLVRLLQGVPATDRAA